MPPGRAIHRRTHFGGHESVAGLEQRRRSSPGAHGGARLSGTAAHGRRYMKNEAPGNSLQATALVHEVYLRLVGVTNVEWKARAQFFAVAAQMMRRVLVDAARA